MTTTPNATADSGRTAFRVFAVLLLMAGVGYSAVMYAMFSGAWGTNCELNGVACAALSPLQRLQSAAMPAAVCAFVVLLAIRVRRYSARASLALVAILPVLLLVLSTLFAAMQTQT